MKILIKRPKIIKKKKQIKLKPWQEKARVSPKKVKYIA